MVVAYTYDRKPVTVHDLNAEGACTALLKDAIKPITLASGLEGGCVSSYSLLLAGSSACALR